MMNKPSLLFCFLLFSCCIQAQTIYSGKNPLNFPVNYQSLQASPEYTRALLDILKSGSMAPGKQPSYQISLESELNLYREQNMTGFSISFSNWSSSGMSEYRRFPLGEFLLPSQIEASIGLKTIDGRIISIIQTGKLDSRSGFNSRGRLNLIPVNGLAPQMMDLQIYYDPARIQELRWKVQAIDDYYVSVGILQELKFQLDQMPPPEPSQSDILVGKLNEADSKLWQVKARNHIEKLKLGIQDPAGLVRLMEEVQQKIASRRAVLNQVFASLDSYYYRKGLDAVRMKREEEAGDWFRRSIALNPFFAPSAYELALIRINKGEYQQAEEELRSAWFGMNPDPQTAGKMLITFKDIFQVYLNKAEDTRKKGKPEEGLDLLNRAEKLCHDIRGMYCHNEIYLAMDRCRQSMLNQFIADGFMALQSGNLDAALGAHDRSRNFCSSHRSLNCNRLDSLKTSIVIAEIGEKMQQAEAFFKAGKIQDAFGCIEFAERKMAENKLEQGEQFIKSASVIAKPIAMEKIKTLSESKNLEEAFGDLSDFLTRYHLEQDTEIQAGMGKYKEELQKRMCEKLQENIREYMNQFERELSMKNYIRAEDACNKTAEILSKHPDCKLDGTGFEEKRSSVLPASVYQKMMNQILEMQSKNQTEEIVKKYAEAEKYFYQFNLEERGLKYKPLKQFALDNFRPSGLMYLAKFYREKNELDQSLSIYQELLNRGEAASRFSKGLYDLGFAFGNRDFKNAVTGKPGELSRKIAGRDSSLRAFYEGYEDGFKKQ